MEHSKVTQFNVFFRPGPMMVSWLIEYSNERLIIDVGCGAHMHLLQMLQSVGKKKLLGIDPAIDYMSYMKQKMNQMLGDQEMIQVIPKPVETCKSIITSKEVDALLVFARPYHGDFVENTLDMMPEGREALYISKQENIEQYSDLGKYREQATIIEHQGTSEDDEVVWSIKK